MTVKSNFNSTYEASYLHDLSMVESNHSVLYTAIADRERLPWVKSLLFNLANDHHEHFEMLKGACESLAETTARPQENEKEFAGVFGLAFDIYKEIIKKEEIPEAELPALAEKLSILESALREKYLALQSKQATSDNLRSIFKKTIINGEDHLKLLENIKTRIAQKESGEILDTVVIGCLPTSLSNTLPKGS
jgi:hypothetical protein